MDPFGNRAGCAATGLGGNEPSNERPDFTNRRFLIGQIPNRPGPGGPRKPLQKEGIRMVFGAVGSAPYFTNRRRFPVLGHQNTVNAGMDSGMVFGAAWARLQKSTISGSSTPTACG